MTQDSGASGKLLTRRKVLKTSIGFGAVVAAGPLLAACGSGTSSGGSKTILFGSFEDPLLDPLKKTILPMYEKETGVKVKWLGDDFQTFYEKGLNDGQSKAGQYDVYLLDDGWVPQYASAKVIVDLGSEGVKPDDGFVPDWLELGYWPPKRGPRVPGFENDTPKLIGLPAVGDFETTTYRKDVLGKAPVSWEDVATMASDHTDPSKHVYGYVFRGATGNGIVASYRDIALGFGGEYFDDKWNVTFTDDVGTRVGKFLIETLAPLSPPAVGEYDVTEQSNSFLTGESLSAVQYSGSAIQQDNPKLNSKIRGKSAHSLVPKDAAQVSQSGIWVATVAASGPNREEAVKLLQWLTSDRIQTKMVRAGITPVRKAAYDDPQAQKASPWLPVAAEQIKLGLGSKPRTGDWTKVEDLIGVQLSKALERKKLGNALEVAAENVTAYLKKQGYYS